ncbi:hotdog family protein [Paenibacillus kobensis]|uniref:hypothetical protein n=1 Tax=Paenibacillus kobensis TaxID=59841 RepID=UPI000FD6F319
MGAFLLIEQYMGLYKPWVLIDKVLSYTDNEIYTQKLITFSDFFLIGHFPTSSIYPGVLLAEGVIQSSQIFMRIRGQNQVVRPTKMSSKFLQTVVPGDIITYHLQINKVIDSAYNFIGAAFIGERQVLDIKVSFE